MTRHRTYTGSDVERLYGYYKNPERFAGSFGTKDVPHGIELLELSDWDKREYSDVPLKENEKLFRMTSDTMRITGQKPLVKINMERGLVYFLDREADDAAVFETRGVKATFINEVKEK